MNKQNVLWALLDLIFLIVFNVVFFVVGGTEHQPSAWLSYGFIHFAYLMVLVTPFLTRKSSNASVFGFALYSIAATYFLIELVVGAVFIVLNQDDIKIALVVQIILAGIFLVMLLSHMIANEKTADAVVRKEAEVSYIMTAATRLKGQLGATGDKQTDKTIEKAYDLVRTSPMKSDPSVSQYELSILDAIDGLEMAASKKELQMVRDYAAQIINSANERKQRLRLVQ